MPFSRRNFLTNTSLLAASSLIPRKLRSQIGAPAGAPDAYAKPKPMIDGPFQPTWESLRDNYHLPTWFNQAKFGIFIHWGLYSIPARLNEWYERHMYTTDSQWHTEHYGPPDKFGYKDFIPLFTVKNYRPDEWAQLFQKSGAKYVVPVAEHHDGFAMWNSDITPWCAGRMGPKRDLTGELATAVRKQNLIFGVSSHRMEHDAFAYPAPGIPNDEFDPKYAGFYGPPIQGEFNNANASKAFQEDWLARVQELVDKYEPQMIYFDNGVNVREYDDVKLRAAAYYYNRAAQWGKQATLATKDVAYLFGSVQDFEKQQRAPKWIYAGGWQCDDAIGSTWGYTESPTPMTYRSPENILHELIELSSLGGNLLLNISPMGDGSIPEAQQKILLANWRVAQAQTAKASTVAAPGSDTAKAPASPTNPPATGREDPPLRPALRSNESRPSQSQKQNFASPPRTDNLYAFGYKYPAAEASIRSLSSSAAKVERVTLLGPEPRQLQFRQSAESLIVTMPPLSAPLASCPIPSALKARIPSAAM